jgi:hypothetical protein
MRKELYLTILYGLFVVALHFFSGRFAPLSSWGFYHLQEFSRPAANAACILAALICLPPSNAAIFDFLKKLRGTCSSQRLRLSPHALYLLISIAFILVFWLLRSGNLFLGDGVTVAKVVRTDEAFRHYVGGWAGYITSHQALDYWLGRVLHRLLSGAGFESYETIALRSCAAGGIFVFAVLETAHFLFNSIGQRLAFSAAILTTGAMQLFFGYVETYSLATAFLALFCLATLLYARGKWPLWPAALALAVSASLHLLTSGAGLALLYAYLFRSRARGRFSKLEFASIAAIPVFIAAVYLIIFTSMGFSPSEIFFPATRKEYEGIFFLALQRKGYLLERYTLFSLPHLIDIANEILLVSPFGLILCLLALPRLIKPRKGHGMPCPYIAKNESDAASSEGLGLSAPCRAGTESISSGSAKDPRSKGGSKDVFPGRPEPWILFLTAAVYLAVTLSAAPLLGARKDWDVFAPPWIFITMLGVYLLIWTMRDERVLGRILIVTLAVSLLCSVPWILSNALVDLDEYLAELGKADMYVREGLAERGLEHYERALEINFTPELAYTVARLRMSAGNMGGAAEALERAIREENRSELALFLEQEDAHFALGSIYLTDGKPDEAIAQFTKALDLWQFRRNEKFTRAADVYYHLGVAHLEKKEFESAEKAFLKSVETGDIPVAHLALARLYERNPAKKELAQKHLSLYMRGKNHGAD